MTACYGLSSPGLYPSYYSVDPVGLKAEACRTGGNSRSIYALVHRHDLVN